MQYIDDSEISLGFATIDGLPNWLQLEQKEIDRISMLLGCIWFLPALRNCISGSLLRRISEVVGADHFAWLSELEICNTDVNPDEGADRVESIEKTGKAILLSLVTDDSLRNFLQSRFAILDTTEIDAEKVKPLVLILEERLSVSEEDLPAEAA